MIFIDEQGTVLFASRVMARLLGQEPEAMEGQPLNEWLATPLQQQWPDLASEREHNLEFLVAGQKMCSTPVPCPSRSEDRPLSPSL